MRYITLVLLLFIGISYASAQDVYTSSGKPGYQKKMKKQKKGYDPDRLIIGGEFLGGAFSNGYISVGIAPVVGYRFTKRLSAGVGLGYQFYQAPEYGLDPVDPNKVYYDRENIIFPNVWARFFVYKNFYISGALEYDLIGLKGPGYNTDPNSPNYGTITTLKEHVTNTCALVGAGLRIPLAGRVSGYVQLVYDVLQGTYSPYPQGAPDVRIGIVAGF